MDKFDLSKIEETPHLLDLLLEMEDVIDSLDVYVFRNWLLGEVVSGPNIRRYWVNMKLMFPRDKMPDPRGGLRLLKHGVLVKYKKGSVPNTIEGTDVDVWFVDLDFPRKLLSGINDSGTDYYEDEIDIDDIESAKDQGVDAETQYTDTEGGEE